MIGRIVCALLLAPLVAAAQPSLTPNDFAYGIPLEVDGDGALYRFDLPDEVYRNATRDDLGDIRIFNGHNEVVPHLLRSGVYYREERREPVTLRFFPLYGEQEDGKADTQVHIATDSEGAVVDFWQRAPEGEKETIRRYLIDASAVERPLEKLLLQWDETAGSTLASVRVEYSDDLNNWRHIGGTQTLASLSYEGFRLGQRELELSSLEAKYLRISWPLGEKGIELSDVKAEVVRQGEPVSRAWLTLTPGGEETHRGVYDFSVDGRFPVDRLKVKLPQPNTVVRAKLLSRATQGETPWRERYSGLLYSLQREGHTLKNDTITLSGVDDPYWRLEVETEGGGIGRGSPLLELGWVAHRVYFVARGETPYSLAFGAATVEPVRSNLTPLLHRLEQSEQGNGFIKPAAPGSLHELGGERRLSPAPPPLPWQKWLLWAVLLVGVLVLVLMARSLYRQMNDADRIE